MIGSSTFLALMLFAATSDDPGMVTVSDRDASGIATVPAGEQNISTTNYMAPTLESESKPDQTPSLLQTLMQDQNKNKKPLQNPFKEEASPPGSTPEKTPPQRLPPVLQNPPSMPPPTSGKGSPQGNANLGAAECSSEDYSSSDSRANCPNYNKLEFCNWFRDITYEAWIDQGFTLNPYSPRDRSNFPVGFNNRSNEYQMNQAYMRLKRDVDREGGRWDLGGTVDLLYGTDSFYTSSRGLEVNRDFSPKWNAQQYGLSLPQCYMEVLAPWGDGGLSVKLGHFYSILGYETVAAPENFFYSHSLSFLYGEPKTETGLLGEKKLENFKIQAGVTRGWDNWEDNNNDLSFLGGISWSDDDGRSSLAFTVQSGPEQDEPPQNVNFRNIFSLVFQQKFGDRFQYVIQYDYGWEERSDIYLMSPAKWIGLNQYLFYTINENWKAGLRFEWFQDQDGIRVPGVRLGADYYELTAGLNWKPHERVVVRPELRYDWVGTPNVTPFVDATKSYQLLLDCDVIVKF